MKTTLALTLIFGLAAAFVAGMPRKNEIRSHESLGFTPLGDLAGGMFDSAPTGISADGSIVIGRSNSDAGVEAFRWMPRGGMAGLGFPHAFAVSADGSAVVGSRFVADSAEPVRWTQRDGLQCLGNITGYVCGAAHGASADGSVIVGRYAPRNGRGEIPFRWTTAGGIARLEQHPNAVVEAEAHAVSSDGEVVVGAMEYESGRTAAFRWTPTSGFVDLGVSPSDAGSIAHAVSADGSVVVGLSHAGAEAFRWTEKTGMVGLGALSGGGRSCAFAVSADGSIIVGQSDGKSGQEAFIWDATHGMRSLRQLILSETDQDASLRGWKLRSATAVSLDGSTIAGFGINPSGNREAWIARLNGKPSTNARAQWIATR